MRLLAETTVVVVAMSSERRLALPLLLGLLWCVSECKWHPGCLCELKETPSASDFSMASIFGTSLFRSGGKVAQFCPCSVETVQQLNRELIAPRLFTLLNRTFFRYARVDLERSCAFWNDEAGSCALRDCAVEACSADEELRLESCDETSSLSRVTRASESALGKEAPSWDFQKIKYSMADWTDFHDEVDGEGGFGEGDGEVSGAGSGVQGGDGEGGQWVDLGDNPEQYTGYRSGASRVWVELHRHNSFHSPFNHKGESGLEEKAFDLEAMPVEQRLFYRLLSGMHASVSSHIAANYLIDRKSQRWGLELDEYKRRLGDHPERLHHLHFAYLTVLRACELASPTLTTSFAYSTGMPREDASVARLVRELLSSQPEWPLTFDEQSAFAGVRCPSGLDADVFHETREQTCRADEVAAQQEVLDAFRHRLHNISRLMDCVGCDRCRLWGKLQGRGLAVTLRILYAPDRQAVLASLERTHVVALFNLLGRLSHSVEVARVVVPLLGAAHSTCSPRGCKATEYQVEEDEEEDEEELLDRTAHESDPFNPFR